MLLLPFSPVPSFPPPCPRIHPYTFSSLLFNLHTILYLSLVHSDSYFLPHNSNSYIHYCLQHSIPCPSSYQYTLFFLSFTSFLVTISCSSHPSIISSLSLTPLAPYHPITSPPTSQQLPVACACIHRSSVRMCGLFRRSVSCWPTVLALLTPR